MPVIIDIYIWVSKAFWSLSLMKPLDHYVNGKISLSVCTYLNSVGAECLMP